MSDSLILYEELPAEGAERRRVLHVTNMWPDELRPHYGSFIASQARSLPAAGIAVDLVYVRGFLGPRAYLKALAALPRASRRRPYDLVHIHYGHTLAAGLGVTRRPLVVSFCGEDLLGAPRERGITTKSRIEVGIFRRLAALATATITKSREMEQELPARLRSRNHVLPNGVDLEAFAPGSRQQARAQLGWSPEERVALFLGNPDDPRKNVGLARAAAEIVRREDPAARLHVAWQVPPETVPVLMNAADCLVFPSKSEGSPNAIKEAMACALPIVASPVGDVSERLDGVEGCYVCERDPQAFAAALRQALAGGRAPAARAAVERLGLDAVAGRLVGIYDDALGRTAVSGSPQASGDLRDGARPAG
jgi:teichuronic acid biosynthesis glycosyltransferase TuaC